MPKSEFLEYHAIVTVDCFYCDSSKFSLFAFEKFVGLKGFTMVKIQ